MEANCKLKMTPLSLTLTLLTLLFAYFHPTVSAELCNPSDKTTLLKIKAYFGPYDDTAFPLWDPKTDCCQWFGIQCDGSTGRVTSFFINSTPNKTDLALPPFFGDLVYLESLTLDFFGSLRGPIPSSFAKLTRLQTLDLGFLGLSGPIPDFLGRLTRLTHLDLNTNKFTSIPSSLGRLKSLNYLDISSNRLTGPIPDSLGQLTGLDHLDLSINGLSGPIPPSLSHLTKATRLDLRGNRLTGSVPGSFGSFNNPELLLFVGNNRLAGPLPRSLGSINISLLDLSANRFTGDASFLFGREKTAMDTIYLMFNHFKFDFSKVEFPIGLRNLDIANNQIYGSLPKQLRQLPLHAIDVSNNKLCGPIPTGRRLKRFSPDNFANNTCLCGPPLPPCK